MEMPNNMTKCWWDELSNDLQRSWLYYVVSFPTRWSLYWPLARCVDHLSLSLSILSTEGQCTAMYYGSIGLCYLGRKKGKRSGGIFQKPQDGPKESHCPIDLSGRQVAVSSVGAILTGANSGAREWEGCAWGLWPNFTKKLSALPHARVSSL